MKQILFIFLVLISLNCLAAPTSTMSIVPIAVDSRTIKAIDENARNNIIATIYNAHDHARLLSNTITIGSGTAGRIDVSTFVTITVDISGTVDPSIRYNPYTSVWELTNDGVTFYTISTSE